MKIYQTPCTVLYKIIKARTLINRICNATTPPRLVAQPKKQPRKHHTAHFSRPESGQGRHDALATIYNAEATKTRKSHALRIFSPSRPRIKGYEPTNTQNRARKTVLSTILHIVFAQDLFCITASSHLPPPSRRRKISSNIMRR